MSKRIPNPRSTIINKLTELPFSLIQRNRHQRITVYLSANLTKATHSSPPDDRSKKKVKFRDEDDTNVLAVNLNGAGGSLVQSFKDALLHGQDDMMEVGQSVEDGDDGGLGSGYEEKDEDVRSEEEGDENDCEGDMDGDGKESKDNSLSSSDFSVDTSGKIPKIILSERARKHLIRPWKYAVVVRLLGRSIEEACRGKFARIAIKVDLNKPLLAKFDIEGRVQNVEYKGLYNICFSCGCFRQNKDSCPGRIPSSHDAMPVEGSVQAGSHDGGQSSKVMEEEFGEWMIAPTRRRRPKQSKEAEKRLGSNGDNLGNGIKGSRLDALSNYVQEE
ncbi:hypothetical protein GH714_031138 [Hevea brasiliensis]|uniref:DUF4283 domain-containing protein n=1 Tax=Hevea brasiliensis TaxID=3981 RepID=A0A6A6LLU1_HEVBR|nr:hypothetical protein GH714_031138 [Hevea brasiliensis]